MFVKLFKQTKKTKRNFSFFITLAMVISLLPIGPAAKAATNNVTVELDGNLKSLLTPVITEGTNETIVQFNVSNSKVISGGSLKVKFDTTTGGSVVATSEPGNNPSAEPSNSPSAEPGPSAEPSNSPSEEPGQSAEPGNSPSAEPSQSAEPSNSPSAAPSQSAEPGNSPSAAPGSSAEPGNSPSAEPGSSAEPTETPSQTPDGSGEDGDGNNGTNPGAENASLFKGIRSASAETASISCSEVADGNCSVVKESADGTYILSPAAGKESFKFKISGITDDIKLIVSGSGFEVKEKESDDNQNGNGTGSNSGNNGYIPGQGATATSAPNISSEPSGSPSAAPSDAPGISPSNEPGTNPSSAPAVNPSSTPSVPVQTPSPVPSGTQKPVTNTPGPGKNDNNNPSQTSVNYSKYKISKSNGNTVKIVSCKKNVVNVTVPSTIKIDGKVYKVTVINKNAFKGNKKLEKVIVGNNIQKIATGAFKGCSNLKKIVVNTKKLKMSKVGDNAFKGINSKATIKVPKSKVNKYKKIVMAKGAGNNVKVVKLK